MEPKKERLENILRAVQDLKEDYYIGTRDAWVYLKYVRGIYSTPEIIAHKVNDALKLQDIGDYRATPERIVGYTSVMEEIGEIVYKKKLQENKDFILESLDRYFRWDPKTSVFYESEIEYHVPYFTLMFEFARHQAVVSDLDFGNSIPEFLRYLAKTMRPEEHYIDDKSGYRLNSNEIKEWIKWMSSVVETSERDWGIYFSTSYLRERETFTYRFFRYVCIQPESLMKRIVKDHVDNNMIYRRQVISSLIDTLCGLGIECEDYNHILKVINSDHGEGNIHFSGLGIPRFDSHLNSFILTEKNFINKILKS